MQAKDIVLNFTVAILKSKKGEINYNKFNPVYPKYYHFNIIK